MPLLFEYIDYRKFLLDYYNEQKMKNRHFSYRYFTGKAGINSSSFLKHVIDGKRNLTRPVIEKFSIAMKLNPKESTYFCNLVLFNQAKTSVEKQEYYAALRTIAGHIKEAVLNADKINYFSQWYILVIRELVTLYDFRDDFKKIASFVNPPILPSEAKAAVKLLLRLEFLKKNDDCSYEQSTSALVVNSAMTSLSLRTFYKTMIDHSKNALENIDADERHISGITMGISPETYSLLTAEIDSFKDRVKAIVNRDKASSIVYHMNLSLFPVSGNTAVIDKKRNFATE